MAPGVSSRARLLDAAKIFKGQITNAVFLEESSQPMEPQFQASVASNAPSVGINNLLVPPQGLVVFKTARASLWRMLGKLAPQALSPRQSEVAWTNSFQLKLYHLSPEFIRQLDDETKPISADSGSPVTHTRLAARRVDSYVSDL
jgi:hypothetical protein